MIWFEIIESFIDGEITDVQCQHCLSATNMGKQYVFIGIKNVCLSGGVMSNVKGKRRVQFKNIYTKIATGPISVISRVSRFIN